ncbi:TPA: hypothetical protein VGS93_005225 [Bacillus cereus]|nr:hypothetical protein [Bacillus cereus]
MNRDLTILDATLREGEQQQGIRFAKEDKIALLHMLEDFGISIMGIFAQPPKRGNKTKNTNSILFFNDFLRY